MSMLEAIPEEYRSIEKKKEFFEYLQTLFLPEKYKRYIIADWCKFTGYKMTADLFADIGDTHPID